MQAFCVNLQFLYGLQKDIRHQRHAYPYAIRHPVNS
jgi:hypothetical protein